MSDQEAKGKIEKTKGKIREEIGKMTGDKSEQIKGKAEQVKGKIQEEAGKAKRKIENRQQATEFQTEQADWFSKNEVRIQRRVDENSLIPRFSFAKQSILSFDRFDGSCQISEALLNSLSAFSLVCLTINSYSFILED